MLLSEDEGKTWRDTGSFAAIPAARPGEVCVSALWLPPRAAGSCRAAESAGPVQPVVLASILDAELASYVMITILDQCWSQKPCC